MAEQFIVPITSNKEAAYREIVPQIRALLGSESDLVANAANICAVLKETFNFLWVGFYFVHDKHLLLGPFQGPVACTRIDFGKGVCGHAWKEQKTIAVPDVELFPGHIACSSLSKSEIVVPLFNRIGNIVGVLDVDSQNLNHFNSIDAEYLESICKILMESLEVH